MDKGQGQRSGQKAEWVGTSTTVVGLRVAEKGHHQKVHMCLQFKVTRHFEYVDTHTWISK